MEIWSTKKVIVMGMRKFGNIAQESQVKEHTGIVHSLMKLIRGTGKGNSCPSSCADLAQDPDQPLEAAPQVYLAAARRMHEVETEKAMVMIEMRHERWKAGGPY